MTMNDMRILVI